MHTPKFARYGWALALLAIGALWLRVEMIGPPAAAQAAPQPADKAQRAAAATTMGVVDIAVVFKELRDFKVKMNDIKEDIEAFDKYVKEETAVLKALVDQSAVSQGQEKEKLEKEATAKTADLQARVGLKKAELLKDEARVYYDEYNRLQDAVTFVARKRKINFVLRFNSESMNRDDRNSVLQAVNRAIIYHEESHDITKEVLEVLNQSSADK